MIKLKVKVAKTFWQQTKGLLGSAKPYPLLLQTRFGIHTFFMKYPIDVIVLDFANKIIALKPHLKPNHIFIWNPKYKTVVELPSGLIRKNKLKLGKQIKIVRV